MSELTHEEFIRLRPKMLNPMGQITAFLDQDVKLAMMKTSTSYWQVWDVKGFVKFDTSMPPHMFSDSVYRVSPDWEGPPKLEPAPAPEFVDCEVFRDHGDYYFRAPTKVSYMVAVAQGVKGFAGYVYDHIKSYWCLQHNDNNELIVPRAVRFRVQKEVAK